MSALQQAIAAIDMHATDDERGLLIAAKCRGLMHGYDARWRDAGWQTVSVEEEFQLPVVNPQTGRASRTFTQAGKQDGIVRFGGNDFLMEHKTTSEDIDDPNAPYWRRLAIDSQVSAYVLANWQNGRKLHGTLYDVIRKPGIRPKQLSKGIRADIVSNGRYCNFRVSDAIRQRLAAGDEKECNTLYEYRLAADTIETPDKYFQRRSIPRLDSDVLEWANELWDVGQEIAAARKNNRHYRNSGACMQYGSPCGFLGICSGYDSEDSANWVRRENVHSELSIQDGRDVLTNSRIGCFQLCRRKHYLKYELGIERVDGDERETLLFGSLFHRALEAWWGAFMIGDSHEYDAGSPANEVGGHAASGQGQLV